MKSCLRAFPSVALMFLTASSLVVIAIGIAEADPPNMKCGDSTMSSCTEQTCVHPVNAECNNKKNWDGYERSSFSYRLCNGVVEPCAGWSDSYKTCESRFYTKDAMNPVNLCATKGCTLTTTISACAP